MKNALDRIARRLWKGYENAHPMQQITSVVDLFSILYACPFLIVGVVWLFSATRWEIFGEEWLFLGILFITAFIVEELDFYLLVKLGNVSGGGSFYGSLSIIPTIAAVFLFGATALWLAVIREIIQIIRNFSRIRNFQYSPQQIRTTIFNLVEITLIDLIALEVYYELGGTTPLPNFSASILGAAFVAVIVRFALTELLSLPYIAFAGKLISEMAGTPQSEIYRFIGVTALLAAPREPFAILAAGIYSTSGLTAFLFLMFGLIMVGVLVQQLSRSAERSRQRTQELNYLEQLGRAIIDGPPDASTLPTLLTEFVPQMFSQSAVVIRIFPAQRLLNFPAEMTTPTTLWQWFRTCNDVAYFLPGQSLPWDSQNPTNQSHICAPILNAQTNKALGGVYIFSQHPDTKGIIHWLPAVQSLAAQIASALHSAETYRRTIEHEKTLQELALAGRIQTSFLPTNVPQYQGWQLSADLDPAHDTSGDFYDFIVLPDNKLGILVADVADKGVGAALYMALSRTLIRTYAMEYFDRPAEAFHAANERILLDTKSDLFVTVFYGVLDIENGTLTYCNAGHNPGYLCHFGNGGQVEHLGKTGIPLGMFADYHWKTQTVSLEEGGMLVLYTDGLTEALSPSAEQFGEKRLLEILNTNKTTPALGLQNMILSEVRTFMGEAPQFDDITLLVIRRELEASVEVI